MSKKAWAQEFRMKSFFGDLTSFSWTKKNNSRNRFWWSLEKPTKQSRHQIKNLGGRVIRSKVMKASGLLYPIIISIEGLLENIIRATSQKRNLISQPNRSKLLQTLDVQMSGCWVALLVRLKTKDLLRRCPLSRRGASTWTRYCCSSVGEHNAN